MNQFVPVQSTRKSKGELCLAWPVGLANFKQPRVVRMWVGFGVVSLADPVLSVVPDKGWNSVSIHVVLGACVMYH